MNAPDSLSRRDALKALGAGAALLGLGALSKRTLGAEPARSPLAMAGVKQPFVLPALGYAYDALEPHIDARTMEIHHTKHHQTYINNASAALAEYPDLRKYSGEELIRNLDAIPEKIRLAVRNNVGGHVNHSHFWKVISPGGGKPSSDLTAAFPRFFGSFAGFQRLFEETAMKRFGSGWVWLVATEEGPLGISSTPNQDSPISDGGWPILGLDVWEHAYYLKYQNLRADYIKAFWNVVNWTEVSANFDRVLKNRPEWARGPI